MDKTWMYSNRFSKDYENGVSEFIKFAIAHAKDPSRMTCPYLYYCYGNRVDAVQLTSHLIRYGIDRSYTCWNMHGEKSNENVESGDKRTYASKDNCTDTYNYDQVEEIAKALEEDLNDCPKMFERLVSNAEKPLYNGCTKFTRLSAVLKLYNLKAGNGWSDKSFTNLSALMKDMLPEDNILSNRTYEAKKMLYSIGMSYDKIHAFPKDCVLF